MHGHNPPVDEDARRSRRLYALAAVVAAGVAAAGAWAPAGATRLDAPRSDAVPILMYHVVADPPASARLTELYVSAGDFRGQVAWLASHGYHAVTLHALYEHWRSGAPLPRRPVVLSFDDGYLSQYRTALPALRERGWVGVLNLEVANETPSWGLSLRHLRAFVDAGWEIDAHTLTHPDLTTLDPVRLRREVAGSRAVIRRQLHVPVDFFCYPSGRYDAAVVAAVRAAGYLGATTTSYGLARPSQGLFTLSRVRVNRSDGVAGLAAKLRALGEPG